MISTSGLVVELRNVPFLSSTSLTTGLATAELNSNGQLQSIGICPSIACISRGTAEVKEAGYDQYVAWGRWTNGSTKVTVIGFNSSQQYSNNSGMHYLIGSPSASLPTSGSATYSLLGATLATGNNTAPLTLSGSASVIFAPNLGTRVGLDVTLSNPNDKLYRILSTGGLSNPIASELRLIGPNKLQGILPVLSTISSTDCTDGTCTATVSGAFFGPEQQRLGLGYQIRRGTGVKIEGVATFKKD